MFEILFFDFVKIYEGMFRRTFLKLGKVLPNKLVKIRIVFFQLFARIELIVLTIWFCHFGIHIEPILNTFGPVFVDVGFGIRICILSFCNSLINPTCSLFL